MIILLVLFILTLYFYHQEKKGEVLFCLMAIGSNCFNFVDPVGVPIKPFDFIIIFMLLTCIFGYSQNRSYFKLSYIKSVNLSQQNYGSSIHREKDWIGIAILAIVAYLTLNFLGTILLRIDSPSNALKVVRPLFTFLLYFYLRTFKLRDFYRFLRLILIASIIQGVFFYLQVIGINVLSGRVDQAEGIEQMTRYANYPSMSAFFVIYYILNEKSTFLYRILFVVFFGMMILLGQSRGVIIRIGCVLALYYFLNRKIKYVGYIAVGIIVYQLAIAPMFEYRTRNSSISTSQDIVNVLTNPRNVYSSYMRQDQEGHFSFRIAMLTERVLFMFDHPRFLPFGVGCIHEESSSNQFFFFLGTHNEMYKHGYAMLGSADIAWVSIIMRYGMAGTMLFLLLFFVWARAGIPLIHKNKNILFIIASLLAVSSFMGSFNSNNIERVPAIMSLIFYFAVIYVFRSRKEVLQGYHIS